MDALDQFPGVFRFTSDVTAWEYRYVDAESQEDQGHDTKADPKARKSGKMAP
jgi:hypothetical protein